MPMKISKPTPTTRVTTRKICSVSRLLPCREGFTIVYLSTDEEDEDLVSTQIAPKDAEPKEESVKLKLARALMKMPCAQSRNTAAFKRVQWDKVEIPGCSEAELKEHLREILKMTSAIRTLGEILADFERNENRFTSRIHKDFPTRPSGAHIKYLAEHRDEITQILEKKNPGEKVSYVGPFTNVYSDLLNNPLP